MLKSNIVSWDEGLLTGSLKLGNGPAHRLWVTTGFIFIKYFQLSSLNDSSSRKDSICVYTNILYVTHQLTENMNCWQICRFQVITFTVASILWKNAFQKCLVPREWIENNYCSASFVASTWPKVWLSFLILHFQEAHSVERPDIVPHLLHIEA